MPKKTIDEKLRARQVKDPPAVPYRILMWVAKLLAKLDNTHFTELHSPDEEPGPIVFIANHASRVDYEFTATRCNTRRINFVVGYNEFFRFPTNILLPMMQVIPKKNFTPDMYAIRQILRRVKDGGSICIMPEGMSSITGMAQPIIPGGAALMKKLGLPVYYSKINGAYLTYTKHCLDRRRGRVDVTIDRMFTPEELKELTEAEIEDRMNCLLAHDDYMWNKEAGVRFSGKGQMAKNLGNLLYRCPRCDALYAMQSEGNFMRCGCCGNEIEIDEYYSIRPVGESLCPELVTDWTIMERQKAAEEVAKPDFKYSGHVKIGVLPEYKPLMGDATSEIRGEGTLSLDHSGLHFKGILEDKPFTFDMSPAAVPTFGMCTDISRFYTFVDGRFIEFYPDRNDVLYWDHLTEELHRFSGGRWQNTQHRHTKP
ncbi:MAG: 1-acyl-sn-glycerol-3-phosphate acyltransferase [Lachnospiraceae bacterium]|nr:1-acyl-sn-glycerol-3-phosphate acyltransferase [Lachnospiraceae bacterium]